jgi:hypothetical protein
MQNLTMHFKAYLGIGDISSQVFNLPRMCCFEALEWFHRTGSQNNLVRLLEQESCYGCAQAFARTGYDEYFWGRHAC